MRSYLLPAGADPAERRARVAIKAVTLALNGQTYTLTKDSTSGKYKATITAPTKSSYSQTDHVYAMVIKASDQAGNVTTIDKSHATYGAKMKLDVNEKVAPVITPSKPGAGAYLTSGSVQIQFDVTDNDSGVNSGTISMQIDSQSAITSGLTKTAITGGYRCTYTATLDDGPHSIKINAKDNDDNAAVQKTVAFTVDTVPPQLNVPVPANGLITNKQSCQIQGTTNDATSAPCTVIVKLNGADQGAVTVNADGTFFKTVSLAKASNTIYVKSTDKAGKYSEVTIKVEYDPDAPVVHSVSITPNPVDAGAIFVIEVDVTD